jgi:tripartite-type tricarboxylate transporter receptor subunit TctC
MRALISSLVALAAAAALPAQAQNDATQSVASFYRNKNVDLQIGYSVGGGYDIYGRLVGQHIGRHIPGNPNIVPKNMPGAGSLRLANWLYAVAPKDGTVFGIIGRGIPMEPLLGGEGVQFDAQKFTWIGSANDEVSICAAWKTASVTKFEDLFTKELIVGGTGSGADTDIFPLVINKVFGTKFKVIPGYPGGNDINLAMERGEVGGRCGWSWSSVKAAQMHWVRDGTVKVLIQISLAKHPDLPDVPLLMDFAKTDEQRQILRLIFSRQVMGRPFLAPPGVPGDRANALRKAFMDTMKNPEFLAAAEKAKLEITPVSGEDLEKLMQQVYATPPEIAKKAAAAVR